MSSGFRTTSEVIVLYVFTLQFVTSSSLPEAIHCLPYRFSLLAHLSRRLTGELIVYPCSGVRPSFTICGIIHKRSSSLKPLGQSKPNFIWTILSKGERKFI